MNGNAVFVWIFLGLAAAVLVGITFYVDSWRRRPGSGQGSQADQDSPYGQAPPNGQHDPD